MEKIVRLSKKISNSQKRVIEQLENNMTVPDLKYGDSYHKIEDQFPRLLKSLGLPAEKNDIRAAAILSKSNLDVNEKNLKLAKLLYTKINALSESLNPGIALSLMYTGQNPLGMTLEELQSYADKSGRTYGAISQTDISRNIRRMEPIMRRAVISLYKAFRMILRDDGAALGYALRSGNTATLGEILDAAANFTKRFNYRIDDVTSVRETIEHEGSIRSEIQRACAYGKTMLTT